MVCESSEEVVVPLSSNLIPEGHVVMVSSADASHGTPPRMRPLQGVETPELTVLQALSALDRATAAVLPKP